MSDLSTFIILLVVMLLLVVAYFRKEVGQWLRRLSEDFRELKNKGRVLLITYQILVPCKEFQELILPFQLTPRSLSGRASACQ